MVSFRMNDKHDTHQTNYAENKGFVKTDFKNITKIQYYAFWQCGCMETTQVFRRTRFFANPNISTFGT